jgi:hypothetical protein
MCADHSTNLVLRLQNGGGPYMMSCVVRRFRPSIRLLLAEETNRSNPRSMASRVHNDLSVEPLVVYLVNGYL